MGPMRKIMLTRNCSLFSATLLCLKIQTALPVHPRVKMQKGGCHGSQPGMKVTTLPVCLYWEQLLTPETIANQPAVSFMDFATQVSIRKLFSRPYRSRFAHLFHDAVMVTHNTVVHLTTCVLNKRLRHSGCVSVRAVHHLLEQRYHRTPWPSTPLSTTQLLSAILKRVGEASGPYQMFEILGDVILLRG